jgi:hypothetical protein
MNGHMKRHNMRPTKYTMDLAAVLMELGGETYRFLDTSPDPPIPQPPAETCVCGGAPWNLDRFTWVSTDGRVVVYTCLNGHSRRLSPVPALATPRPQGAPTHAEAATVLA